MALGKDQNPSDALHARLAHTATSLGRGQRPTRSTQCQQFFSARTARCLQQQERGLQLSDPALLTNPRSAQAGLSLPEAEEEREGTGIERELSMTARAILSAEGSPSVSSPPLSSFSRLPQGLASQGNLLGLQRESQAP